MEAAVSPSASGNWTDRYANVNATRACPINLVLARRPVLRCLKIFK